MFKLKPDIVIKNINGDKTVILDTKWKALINNRSKNYGISQSDMYQMFAYSKKYSTNNKPSDVWLLYPKNENMIKYSEKNEYRDEEQIVFKSKDNTTVRVFFVDVAEDR